MSYIVISSNTATQIIEALHYALDKAGEEVDSCRVPKAKLQPDSYVKALSRYQKFSMLHKQIYRKVMG